MTITERIEAAIKERHRQMMKPAAVVLGPLEADALRDWLTTAPAYSKASRLCLLSDLDNLTYNGLPIRLSENDGIDILT